LLVPGCFTLVKLSASVESLQDYIYIFVVYSVDFARQSYLVKLRKLSMNMGKDIILGNRTLCLKLLKLNI
jgi:hypothetical protein